MWRADWPMIRPIVMPGTVTVSEMMGGWSTITFLTISSAWCTASCMPRITSVRSSSFWPSPLKLIRVLVDSWIWNKYHLDTILLNYKSKKIMKVYCHNNDNWSWQDISLDQSALWLLRLTQPLKLSVSKSACTSCSWEVTASTVHSICRLTYWSVDKTVWPHHSCLNWK